MNENEFEYKGVTYVAVDATRDEDGLICCDGCAMSGVDVRDCFTVKCSSFDRKDNRNVIFVEKKS